MEGFLKDTFIFQNLSDEEYSKALSIISPCVKHFEKDELIFSPDNFTNEIGFIMSGKCTANKSNATGHDVPLKVFNKNDAFGIISVLSNRNEYPTCIVANETSDVLFITKDDVRLLIKNFPTISHNFISFLAERIVFLNDKISTFSAYNVEQKLSNYLLQLYRKNGSKTLKFSRTGCALAINSGRASLYRALDSLKEKKIISISEKQIIINDLEGLERNSK